ncbi:MAG: LEA type 2 family protein [Pseudobdellovibrio sp.]
MKILISVLLMGASLGLLTACADLTKNLLKDPEVKVIGFKLASVSAQDMAVEVNLNVKNPNPIPINLDQVDYALSFSGEKVTEGTFDKGIQIPASGEGQLTVPLKFKFNSVGNILTGLINRSFTKDYELVGSAKLGIFSIPFTKKGEINLNL